LSTITIAGTACRQTKIITILRPVQVFHARGFQTKPSITPENVGNILKKRARADKTIG